jgi:methylmalonyl-CoA mutase cobalamin-binding domain/chain
VASPIALTNSRAASPICSKSFISIVIVFYNSQLPIQHSTFFIAAGDNSTFKTQHSTFGKVLIGTVKGDLHDIGKNLVAAMLEGCGFEVVNIGIDVSAEQFIEEVKKHQPDILALSALLTTTMPYMREVISQLQQAGIRDRVKVIIGGAPVSQRFADEIGADGYSDNANSAVALVKNLLKR